MPVINEGGGTTPVPTDPNAPCADWPIQWICDVSTASPAVTALAVTGATEILYALSGRRFGVCEVTSRPCRHDCWDPFPDNWAPWETGYPRPALVGGLWFNLACGSCPRTCTCTTLHEVLLPAPVYAITEVKVDGVALATSAYRLDDNRRLVRVDGQPWPWCNDLSLADTDPGTWSITAQYGEPIPDLARLAMGEMACELVRAATGADCRLPAGIQQLARQGVTIDFPEVGELFTQGRTGLYLVDAFIATYNPNHLARRSRVYSVDRPPFRRAGT